MASLRKRVNQHCRDCIYDPKSHGTWRQQVTLCAITSCALHDVRPLTKSRIPSTVLNAHQRAEEEHAALLGSSGAQICPK